MLFQKHNWVKYNSNGIVVNLTLTECSGEKIDSFRFNNNKDYSKILNVLENKYGFKRENIKEMEETEDKEKDWLTKQEL